MTDQEREAIERALAWLTDTDFELEEPDVRIGAAKAELKELLDPTPPEGVLLTLVMG